MLHPGDGLPVRAVPSVDMTTVGTSPVAVPNLALTGRRSIERGETTLALTRLTFHRVSVRPLANGGPAACGHTGKGTRTFHSESSGEGSTMANLMEVKLGGTSKAFINFDQVISVVASTDDASEPVVIIRATNGDKYEERCASEAEAGSRAASLANLARRAS